MQCGASLVGPAGACAADGKPADPLRDEVASFMDSYFFAAGPRPQDLVAPAELKSGCPAPCEGKLTTLEGT